MTAVLVTSHAMLAGITKVPEFVLDVKEGSDLALAISEVNKFYQVEVAEKTLAWVNLAMVGGMIYGTRLVAYRMRVSGRRNSEPVDEAPRGEREAAPASPATDVAGSMDVPDTFIPGFGPTVGNA